MNDYKLICDNYQKEYQTNYEPIKECQIDVMVDWGYAGDIVIAMQKILDLEKSGNFIIATGKTSPLKNFVEFVFNDLNLDWRKYIEIKPNLIKRKPINNLCGDYSKLSQMTGWSPKYELKDIAEIMVNGSKHSVIRKRQSLKNLINN